MADRYHPDRAPGRLWDDLARENSTSAIMYHATPEWFAESGERDAHALHRIMRSLGTPADMTVLDLGGGVGRIALTLAPRVRNYYLLDASAEMLRQAAEYLAPIRGRVTAVHGNGYDLTGVPDASIDFCFSWLVLQHLDREVTVRYLMDLRQVLKPWGRAFLHAPMMCYPARFEEAERGDWPANFRRWQPGELLEVLVRLGYAVEAGDCDRGQFLVRVARAVPWLVEGGESAVAEAVATPAAEGPPYGEGDPDRARGGLDDGPVAPA